MCALHLRAQAWPYISDTGREGPRYYLFAIGLSLTAIGVSYSNWVFWRSTFSSPAKACCATADVSLAAVVLVGTSAPFLILLAVMSTIEHPSVHDISAYIFFVLQTVAIIVQTVALARRQWSTPRKRKAQIFRNVVAFCYCVLFLIYLPIGLAINCPWARLSMRECIYVQRLGEAYCRNLQLDSDPNLTKLWDYSGCPGTNNMRSVSQTLCVMCLVLFYGSFTINLSEPETPSTLDAGGEQGGEGRKDGRGL